MERFNLKKLSEVRKLYQIKISKEVCSFGECINRAWENIKDNIKTSAKDSLDPYELKQHKPWFDECLHFLDERKQAKLQWVQDPSQRNVDNINNVRCEASRHFRNKEGISES